MSALREPIVARPKTACEATSSGFAPDTVTPPDRFLRGLAAARAGLRNPVELWDRALFSLPCREMRRFGRRFIEIADPVLMHQVLVVESDAFTRSEFQLRFTRPLVGDGILAAVGESWRTQRRAAAPCFRRDALNALLPAVAAAGARAVTTLAYSPAPVDVMPVMMRATFDVVAELLGVDAGALDQAAIDDAGNEYLKGVGLGAISDIFGFGWLHRRLPLKGNRAIQVMRGQARRAVKLARSDADRSRLLAHLAKAFGQNGSDCDDGLRDSVIAFIAAGNETVAVALSWALHLIAHDRIVQSRLAEESRRVLGEGPLTIAVIDELDLHLRVIKEALRLFPPIALMQRTATRPVTIGGVRLSPGDEAVCAIYVMHRSPRLWDNPQVFDPERFKTEMSCARHRFTFLPFGAGQHACLGMPLAYMEMVAILAQITRSHTLAPDLSQRVRPVMRLTLRPEDGVRLRVTKDEPLI